MKPMKKAQAIAMGFSADKRKCRRQHRKAAQKLLRIGDIAMWHLGQARAL